MPDLQSQPGLQWPASSWSSDTEGAILLGAQLVARAGFSASSTQATGGGTTAIADRATTKLSVPRRPALGPKGTNRYIQFGSSLQVVAEQQARVRGERDKALCEEP